MTPNLADVVLTDILDGPPAGKALDMAESAPILGTDSHAVGISTASGDYKETANSDIIVITAGFPRKPGMSRDDLLKANYDVVKGVVEAIVKLSPGAILIIVTNPLDAMAQAAFKISGFSRNRVIGMAGVLDSARMSAFVAAELSRVRRKCALVRSRRPRRRNGATRSLFHRRRNPAPRAAIERKTRSDHHAHPERRRRNRRSSEDRLCLLRAVRRSGRKWSKRS